MNPAPPVTSTRTRAVLQYQSRARATQVPCGAARRGLSGPAAKLPRAERLIWRARVVVGASVDTGGAVVVVVSSARHGEFLLTTAADLLVGDVGEGRARVGREAELRALGQEADRDRLAVLLVVVARVAGACLPVDRPGQLALLALVLPERAGVAVAPALLAGIALRARPRVDRVRRHAPVAVVGVLAERRVVALLRVHEGVGVDQAVAVRVDARVLRAGGSADGCLEGRGRA